MIESVVIGKNICFPTSVIRRVNVNQFDLAAELFFEGVECNEVIALDDEILANDTLLVPLKLSNFTK